MTAGGRTSVWRIGVAIICVVLAPGLLFPLIDSLPTLVVVVLCVAGSVVVISRPDWPSHLEPPAGYVPGTGWRDRFALWANDHVRLAVVGFFALGSIAVAGLFLFRGAAVGEAATWALTCFTLALLSSYGALRFFQRHGVDRGPTS